MPRLPQPYQPWSMATESDNPGSVSASAQDRAWMGEALAEATRAAAVGEVPVGALVVLDGQIIGRGANAPIATHDPTAHAEILALRQAGRNIGNYRLPGATLYTTVEPCLMCMGALLHARVARLVFGCFDPKAGATGSVFDVPCDTRLTHSLDVTGGVWEVECRGLLQRFFLARRRSRKT